MQLELGISTCPNDTYMFHAIIEQKIDLEGLQFNIRYLDVQELNDLVEGNALDVSKVSFHAAVHFADRYGILRAGAALGKGVGPLLLSKEAGLEPAPQHTICCPGAWTTATLLLRLAYPNCPRIEHRVFSEIMPAVQEGQVDFGVVIHEGRFTYQDHGLHMTSDLGTIWEERTGSPVPLGGIVAKHDLGEEIHGRLRSVLQRSVEYANAHREETLPTMRQHAQELADEAIWPHVDLYVNQFSLDLGDEGVAALAKLDELTRVCGIVSPEAPPLKILG
jgi:1,4-dihydroxy-6-naphthoate synthase